MPFRKVAMATVVVCLAAASVVDADQRGERRRRGRDTHIVVQPRIVVRPPVVARRYGSPWISPYAGRRAYRPVYRPGIGFGIYIGSPYRYGYPNAYPYPYAPYGRRYAPAPYPYGYYGYPMPYPSYGYTTPYPSYPSYPYPGAGVSAVPLPNPRYGGVQLEVTPRDAAVYVDGYYAGIVDDFDGVAQRLALEPGPHRFEIVAPGLQTLAFDVNVRENETVRYRGEMVREVR